MASKYLRLHKDILRIKRDVKHLILVAPERDRERLLLTRESLSTAALGLEYVAYRNGQLIEEEE